MWSKPNRGITKVIHKAAVSSVSTLPQQTNHNILYIHMCKSFNLYRLDPILSGILARGRRACEPRMRRTEGSCEDVFVRSEDVIGCQMSDWSVCSLVKIGFQCFRENYLCWLSVLLCYCGGLSWGWGASGVGAVSYVGLKINWLGKQFCFQYFIQVLRLRNLSSTRKYIHVFLKHNHNPSYINWIL